MSNNSGQKVNSTTVGGDHIVESCLVRNLDVPMDKKLELSDNTI